MVEDQKLLNITREISWGVQEINMLMKLDHNTGNRRVHCYDRVM